MRRCHASRDAGARWRPILVLVLTCGCGRIGYDLLDEAAEGAAGEPPDATTDVVAQGDAIADRATVDDEGPADVEAEDQAAGPEVDVADSGQERACVTSPAVDYCTYIPPLPATPVIDGVLDCGPTLVPIVPVDWRGAAPLPPFPAGNTAELAAAWRPDGLYVFMAVTTPAAIPADPTSRAYFGAGVELFVDQDGVFTSASYGNPGTIQLIVTSPPYVTPDASAGMCPDASVDAAPDASTEASTDASVEASDGALDEASMDATSDASTTGQRGEQYRNEADLGPWTSTQFGTFATPTGFVFEGFIVAADLGLPSWSLAAGGTVGFDVAVDVSFPTACTTGLEGHRAGQYFLHVSMSPPDAAADAADAAGPIGPPFQDVRSFCTPALTSM